MIEFFMAMKTVPTVTAQEHRVTVKDGKPIFYDPPMLSDARQKIMAHLSKHKPAKPINCGVRLVVRWCFPTTDRHPVGYRITKPDTDNLQKLLKDCMTSIGFWKDDCLVASELCEKMWLDPSGIYVRIEELET